MFRARHIKDRRVQKTQDLLRKALASLISEKKYSAIVIKEILARANVGRSAFYAHYRGKDELLTDSIHEMLTAAQARRRMMSSRPEESLTWFSLPIFEYHYQHRHNESAFANNKHMAFEVAHEHLGKVLIELIGSEVNDEYRKRPSLSNKIPAGLLVEHVISSFILVLNWWVDNKMGLAPSEIDQIYLGLVETTIKDFLE